MSADCPVDEMALELQTLHYSKYFKSLDKKDRERYLDKTEVIGHIDPYTLKRDTFEDVSHWPNVEHNDIFHYLVYTTSFISAQEMRAYKSLQSYDFFISGWVQDVSCTTINGKSVVIGKVSCSTSFLIPLPSLFY